jgi:hypothetical protein
VAFIKEIRDELGGKALGWRIVKDGEQQQLREAQQPYNGHFDTEKDRLRQNIALK